MHVDVALRVACTPARIDKIDWGLASEPAENTVLNNYRGLVPQGTHVALLPVKAQQAGLCAVVMHDSACCCPVVAPSQPVCCIT